MKYVLILATLSLLATFVAWRLVRFGDERRPVPRVIGARGPKRNWIEGALVFAGVCAIALLEWVLS